MVFLAFRMTTYCAVKDQVVLGRYIGPHPMRHRLLGTQLIPPPLNFSHKALTH